MRDDGRSNIICEGTSNQARIELDFDSREEWERYIDLFCSTWDYKFCPVYIATMQKYGEQIAQKCYTTKADKPQTKYGV